MDAARSRMEFAVLILRWLAVLCWLGAVLPAVAAPRIVAYYPFWASYNRGVTLGSLPVEELTHLVYAYAVVQADGRIAPGDVFADTLRVEAMPDGENIQGNYRVLRQLKERNPDLKIMLSMGGWDRSASFSAVFADPALRRNWVQSFFRLQDEFGFDGLELDWRYPVGGGAANTPVSRMDWQSYATAISELRQACSAAGRQCEIAVTIGPLTSQRRNADWPALLKDADFASVLAADFHGSWNNNTGHKSPLYPSMQEPDMAVQPLVQGLLADGVPPEKLVLQLSMLASGWDGVPGVANGLGQASKQPSRGSWDRPENPPSGQLAYADIKPWLNGRDVIVQRDPVGGVPYLYRPALQQFVSYEDEQSLAAKLDFAREHQLAGVGFWDVSADLRGPGSLLQTAYRFYYPGRYWNGVLAQSARVGLPWLLGGVAGVALVVAAGWLLWRRRCSLRDEAELRRIRRLQQGLHALPCSLTEMRRTTSHLLDESAAAALPAAVLQAIGRIDADAGRLVCALDTLYPVIGDAGAAAAGRQDIEHLGDYTRALKGQRSLEEMLEVLRRFALADERVDAVSITQLDDVADAPASGCQLAAGRDHMRIAHPLLNEYCIVLSFRGALPPEAEAYFCQLAEQIILLREQVQELLGQQQLLCELFEIASRRDRLHFVHAESGYSGIHAADLREPRFITLRLRTLRQYFDETTLLQVHRSYLVSPRAVVAAVRVRGGVALSVGGKHIPVSRSQLARIRHRYPAWFAAVEGQPA